MQAKYVQRRPNTVTGEVDAKEHEPPGIDRACAPQVPADTDRRYATAGERDRIGIREPPDILRDRHQGFLHGPRVVHVLVGAALKFGQALTHTPPFDISSRSRQQFWP